MRKLVMYEHWYLSASCCFSGEPEWGTSAEPKPMLDGYSIAPTA